MPVVFRDNETFSNLRENIKSIGNLALTQKLKKQEESRALQDAVRKSLITSVLSGKGKFKTPVNMDELISGGTLPNLSDFSPINQPSTSVSISQRPYSEILKAREILGRTPGEYGKVGMATPGKRIPGTGILGTGFGPGSQREFNLSPQAIAEQSEAKQILGNPYKKTIRQSYKGDVIDTTASDVTSGLPDPSTYEEGTTIEDDSGNQYKLENGEWVTL